MEYLVTLASHGEDGLYDRTKSLKLLMEQCARYDIVVDDRFIWSWDRFKTTHLYQAYKHLMTPEHKLGYWLWKPYIILDALYQLDPDDIICYMDSDLSLGKDPLGYIRKTRVNKIGLWGSAFLNKDWAHEECFSGMGMEGNEYRNTSQIWGAIIFALVCPWTMKFMTDFLIYCTNESILYTDNKRLNTRWAQSVLTNLAVYEGVEVITGNDDHVFAHPAS